MTSLEALLEHLVPTGEGTPEREIPVADHVRRNLPDLEGFLDQLGNFGELSRDERTSLLTELDRSGDPVFQRLVLLAHEAFWADPRAWALVGYTTLIPGRP